MAIIAIGTLFAVLAKAAATALVTVGATWLGKKIIEKVDDKIDDKKAEKELLENDDEKPSEKEQAPTIPNVTDVPKQSEEVPKTETTQSGSQSNIINGITPTKPLDWTGGQSTTKEPESQPGTSSNNPGFTAPTVKDETETNIQNPVEPFMSSEEWMKFIQEEQAKRWAREDAIRKETQQREDTAYSRAISDMRKAGINPNLLGSINPAESGGGITQASGMNFDGLMNQMKIDSEQLMQLIEQNWQGDENDKDRVIKLITSILQIGILFTGLKKTGIKK